MLKLKKFLIKEELHGIQMDEKRLKFIDDLILYCLEMGENSKVLWKGIKTNENKVILHVINSVINNRNEFYNNNLGVKVILKKLNIKNPIFSYLGIMRKAATFFGKEFALILKKPYKFYQSDIVSDISAWSKETIYLTTKVDGGDKTKSIGNRSKIQQIKKAIEGAKTYKSYNNINEIESEKNEIIIDCKEYYAINIDRLFFILENFSESNPDIKFTKKINTYSDIIYLLKLYKKFVKFKLKK